MQSNASTKKKDQFQASTGWFKTSKNSFRSNNLKCMKESHSANPYATTAMFPKLQKQMT